MKSDRARKLNDHLVGEGPVVYWMQRDQRVHDNWALLYAQEHAIKRCVPLYVVFNLTEDFPCANLRHFDFMLDGLREVEQELRRLNIPFVLLQGNAVETVPTFIKNNNAGHVVTDFSPLRFARSWRQQAADAVDCLVEEVDAHNVVPCWVVSDKEEYAAYTIRPKIHRLLPEWLEDFPTVTKQTNKMDLKQDLIDWKIIKESLTIDRSVLPVEWLVPGSIAAYDTLQDFIENKLADYDAKRNDPTINGTSHLSPYLHFGHISPQRVALEVQKKRGVSSETKEAYLEELIVRRELADNYCLYNEQYDQVSGAHAWAQKTIAEHRDDPREYTYNQEVFESAKTHDDLWNAMQLQMVTEGKMHGWCRMYWAKKILEWTPNVQTAIDVALYLNDKYELDGRDPNGVVGVMWSICGVHDRAWTERSVFGKVRYMNFNGAKRKFDVQAYIDRYVQTQTLFND